MHNTTVGMKKKTKKLFDRDRYHFCLGKTEFFFVWKFFFSFYSVLSQNPSLSVNGNILKLVMFSIREDYKYLSTFSPSRDDLSYFKL